MPYGKRVVFHEEGRQFVWYPASMQVTTADGRKIQDVQSPHLEIARRVARGYNARVRSRA